MIRASAALAALLLLTAPAVQAATKATGLDSITTPGHPVEACGKFEYGGWRFWHPDMHDKGVTFDVAGVHGAARTGRDGVARFQVTPTTVGVFPVEARLDGSSAVARGRLWVLDPNRPVVVVDIDGTISDMKDFLVPFMGDRARAFPGSVAVMTDLARTHQVVYLTARDDSNDTKTRAFLQARGFPDGPIVYNEQGLETVAMVAQFDPKNHGAYKLRAIQGMVARGAHVTLGIGNAETDGFAYENAGLPSYLNTKTAGAGPSFRFTAWEPQLRARLVQDGHLPATPGLVGGVSHP